jgi:hypothetical protein
VRTKREKNAAACLELIVTEGEREEKRDALRRYEQVRREHLGAAANLTFALASGGVGFCASLITSKEPVPWASPATWLFVAASGLFIVAVGLSLCLMWTRLQDFRLTADKLRMELRSVAEEKISGVAKRADRFGIWTWRLYRAQFISFGLAMVLLLVSLVSLYGHHLFPRRSDSSSDVQWRGVLAR